MRNGIAIKTLEEEVLLAHVLGVNRSYLYAHPERTLTETEQTQFAMLMNRHEKGEPIAYLTGHREFWSLDLMVTADTLIPRPETELLVETVLEFNTGDLIADLGTGSGAIALALAYERPDWTLYATDSSKNALAIAKKNAERLNIKNIYFYQGFWCAALPEIKLDLIVSNPPYIAEGDLHVEQAVLAYEPLSALISGEGGLQDIKHIIQEAAFYLKSGGYLLLEHGFEQAKIVQNIFLEVGYTNITTRRDLSGLPRVTIGQWQSKF